VLTDWRGLAAKHAQATRQLLRKLLVGRLVFTPDAAGQVVRFTGRGTQAPLVGRLQLRGVQTLVTPAGFAGIWTPDFKGLSKRADWQGGRYFSPDLPSEHASVRRQVALAAGSAPAERGSPVVVPARKLTFGR
jgi:hypothetical protein